MAESIYKVTEEFEKVVAKYTGAPYAVALDCCSNGIFLCLKYLYGRGGYTFSIPSHTYPSVPCAIINSGNRVKFHSTSESVESGTLTGEYMLRINAGGSKVWDSALTFTSGMYRPGQYQCLSFSGPRKHLKLSKGGMILTDNKDAYEWFKKARFSGRGECSYHEDNFIMTGYNMYLDPEKSIRGLLLMEGMPKHNEDKSLLYPDLSKFQVYTDN